MIYVITCPCMLFCLVLSLTNTLVKTQIYSASDLVRLVSLLRGSFRTPAPKSVYKTLEPGGAACRSIDSGECAFITELSHYLWITVTASEQVHLFQQTVLAPGQDPVK